MTTAMPLAQRLRLAGAQSVAAILITGANFVANHGLAAAMELAGAACVIVYGVMASNTIVWVVVCIFDVLVLIIVWMQLQLFFGI